MIINGFLRFVNESKYDVLAESVASAIILFIKHKGSGKMVRRVRHLAGSPTPVDFVLLVNVVESSQLPPAISKKLPWESINFENNGFSVDANSYIPMDSPNAEVKMDVVVRSEADVNYESLYFKLLDTVRHEIEHIISKASGSGETRKESQDSYVYFLLPDEIPSMVSGMRLSASKRGVPIETEFANYLQPILASGFITKDQYEKVMAAWKEFAFSHFPDTK